MQDNPKHIELEIVNNIKGLNKDLVSIEEPLEISISHPDKDGKIVEYPLAVTMRTPGDDTALAVGFLFGEGIIGSFSDIEKIEFFGPPSETLSIQNQIKVALFNGESLAEKSFQRYFYTNSSCGVCGKASIAALQMQHQPTIYENSFTISQQALKQLPARLRRSQSEFGHTGGLHGVALVDCQGNLLWTMEDIGRHNAMDKLIGKMLMEDTLQTADKMVLVSGRASFELLQKSLMADISFFAAIGAPSSAAVDLAKAFGTTLVGFLRDDNYNIYHQPQRILP